MSKAAIAQFIAGAAAVLSALLGVCALYEAGSVVLSVVAASSAQLEQSNARSWRQAASTSALGFGLIGYAAAHVALCRSPSYRPAIAARLAFTVAACAIEATIIWTTLNAPSSPNCGMKWLADMFVFSFAAGLASAEIAAWLSWWSRNATTRV